MDPIILAYSGGLDTSFLIPYLKEKYNAPIVAVHVNTGGLKDDQIPQLTARAKELGASDVCVIDARQKYANEVISYLIKGNILRGEVYPLCVGAERVTQAQELVRIAKDYKSNRIAHGSTAAGNDQVRFEIYLRVLAPEVEILAPVRDEGFKREEEVAYLQKMGFSFSAERAKYSVNHGIWGTTIGARDFQNPSFTIPEDAYQPTTSASVETLSIEFENGLPVAIDGKKSSLVELLETIAARAGSKGIGRGIHIGNTALGIKGRIAFEAPAAAILLQAHRELEKIILTKWEMIWKRELSEFYGNHLHEGHYFDPVMREIEAFVDRSQIRVTGKVTLKLSPFYAAVETCESPYSLTNTKMGTYGEETLSWTGEEAKGFAKIGSIPTQLWHLAGGNS